MRGLLAPLRRVHLSCRGRSGPARAGRYLWRGAAVRSANKYHPRRSNGYVDQCNLSYEINLRTDRPRVGADSSPIMNVTNRMREYQNTSAPRRPVGTGGG